MGVLAPLFKLLEATLELFVPLVMAAIIDDGIANKDNDFILKMGIVLVVIAGVGLAVAITAQFFSAKAACGFASDISKELFIHISKLSKKDYDRVGASTLITRISSDVSQVQTGVNLTLRLLLRSPFIVFGAMIMAFTVDVQAAIIFVVLIPVLAIVVGLLLRICIPLYKNVQKSLDKVILNTRENYSGVRHIRAYAGQKKEAEKFDELANKLQKNQIVNSRVQALMNPVTFVVVNIGIIALIYTGAVRVDTGVLSQGQVVALVNYMSQILVELVKLANLIISINKALACWGRIDEVLGIPVSEAGAQIAENRTKPDVLNAEKNDDKILSDNRNVLELKDVSFSYPDSSEPALKNISLELKIGETLGVIGGTGSGKSTLIKLLAGEYEVNSGSVSVNAPKNEIGIAAQKAVLFSGSVKENLCLGRDASDTDIRLALETAVADEFTKEKGGVEAEVEAKGRNFSGGQRQRLSVARALLKKPELLILDDSFSALDTVTEKTLSERIKNNYKNTTKVIISQRINSIKNADKILVLEDGECVGYGTHDNLMEKCDIYREIARIGGVSK